MERVTAIPGCPGGALPEPQLTPMMRAIRDYGVPLPTGVLQALNCIGPKELQRQREAAMRRSIVERAEHQRRMREDRIAMEMEASRWRG